jgi:hypothetical protein
MSKAFAWIPGEGRFDTDEWDTYLGEYMGTKMHEGVVAFFPRNEKKEYRCVIASLSSSFFGASP